MKFNFTLFMLISVLLLTTCSACSNSVDDDLGESTNYMKVTVDDKEEIYSDVSARWLEDGRSLEITATKSGSSWISITVLAPDKRVAAGVYALNDASGFDIVAIHQQLRGDAQLNFSAVRNMISPTATFAMKLEKLTDRAVEGSFSGKLIILQGPTVLHQVALTKGSFSTVIRSNN
ncbi:hypothetical protein [Sphingobacterium griseoflavum]|uniref:Uncharacterized protein n=1 Tax=Sphingobacterium griseoflavum TaxID=1474952 RepID=A0ABQ3HV15_9SPHI|nr:hypothetical protein [Sphingobacterium griseoflavum]GHE31096.1 hypothetical protein GCM10017764_12690 [Sphingobacterium griseoflavum]